MVVDEEGEEEEMGVCTRYIYGTEKGENMKWTNTIKTKLKRRHDQ